MDDGCLPAHDPEKQPRHREEEPRDARETWFPVVAHHATAKDAK